MTDPLTIVFMPESAYGPTNNCIGIGKILEQRGHRVVFAAEASWKGRLEPLGFEEDLVDLAPPAEGDQDAGQFWTDFITETAPEFRKPTIEQLDTFIRPVWESLIDGAKYCEPQLREILARAQPDVIVEDNVSGFAALLTHGAPWVRIMSCNPLEMKDPDLPPTFSGYPIDDPSGWEEFRAEYERTHRTLWSGFNEWMLEQGAPPLPDLEFIHESDAPEPLRLPGRGRLPAHDTPWRPPGTGSNHPSGTPRNRGPYPTRSGTTATTVPSSTCPSARSAPRTWT